MKKKVAIVCFIEKSLENDDRIRKECIALSKKMDCYIFVGFKDNREETGITSYGVEYQSFHLLSRDILPHGKMQSIMLPLKGLEFYFRIIKHLKGYDYVWCVEEFTSFFVMFHRKGKYIWDLHEIPTMFTGSCVRRSIFRYIEKRCYRIVHANEERLNYIQKIGMVRFPERHFVVHNYPDMIFLNSLQRGEKYKIFEKWRGNLDYVYLQGLGVQSDERYPYNTIYALLQSTEFKILVVGGIEKDAMLQLRKTYKGDIDSRLLSLGSVPSLEIPEYTRHALFSVVFYNYDNPNCRYCEANRFYNTISMGVPVLVGANETMKNVCDKFKVGVSIKEDGRNINDIVAGLDSLILNLRKIRKECEDNARIFRWSDNDVLRIFNN